MRLLWVSNDPRHSWVGQSRVTREIVGRLYKGGIDTHVCAFGGPPYEVNVPYPVHTLQSERHSYPKALIAEIKPDVLVCSHDCWLFYWLQQCRQDFPQIKLVGYYTIDGGPIHGSWWKTMRPLDLLLSPTRFGKQEIYGRYPEKHIGVIPYGVDHGLFNITRPKEEEKNTTDAKVCGGEKQVILANKCIFIYVGQNQARKNIANLLEGFELANLEHSHLFVLTHCGLVQIGGWEGMGEYDLVDLIGTFDNKHRITVVLDPTPDLTLASMYRVSDYFVLPSQGEAPGLPILESMACGCVPIVTDYAGVAEIATVGYKLGYTMLRGQFNVNRAVVNADTIAKSMIVAHDAWQAGKHSQLSAECIKVAQQYDWNKTADLWKMYLQGLIEEKNFVDTDVERCLRL